MNLLLRFEDPLAARAELTGGKGANLAILTQRGFNVPAGFVVTAPAYREFIRSAHELIRGVAEFDFGDAGRLRTQCEGLRTRLRAMPLPAEVADGVRAQLAGHPAGQAFSVRSSSTMEDLASAAFAGQHDTYLNIRGVEAVVERLKECYLSLWQDRAVAYRQRQGFDHALAAMAVVVQRMIPCEVAGVGFSINPITGDLGEMILDANFGLGESVVSGEGQVDHFEIEKATRKVRRESIASKTRRVITTATGTEEVQVDGAEAGRRCLTAEQLGQVADLLVRVEQSYQFPQDIEWGFAGGGLYLLQARPITTIPPRWTRDESAERFPNVIAPLTWDFVETGFHRSLQFSFRLMGFPPFSGKWFGMHGHYIYGNQNAVELYAGRSPFQFRTLEELRALLPRLREEFRWVQELPVVWMRDLDEYLISIGEYMAEPLATRSLGEVWGFVQRVVAHGSRYFEPNIAISLTHSGLYRLLHRLLAGVAGEEEGRRLFDALLGWCDTKTAQINKELFELAQRVRSLPALEQELTARGSRGLHESGGLARFPEFQRRFEQFLRVHGHREIEFDAYAPPWSDAPWVVLDNVRVILQTPMDTPPAQRERELKIRAQQAEFGLLQRLPEDLRFFFSEIIRLARVYTSLDDLEHYETMRLNQPLRRGLRELGRRLVAKGVLADAMDIFFAHVGQIDDAVKADTESVWREFGATVRQQKGAYLADQARRPEWVLGQAAPEAAGEGTFQGLAGSAGVAEGPVHLVLGPDDFGKFTKGSVLVARTTNPTWTPLFYSAIAVITESGGPLSHGAVTAREMRIPAVMAVKECLSQLKNGQRVRVDGTNGRVQLLPG